MNTPDSTRILPPATVKFLEQAADVPGVVSPEGLSYVASVVLPATGWSMEEFMPRLARELAQGQNLAILERAQEEQQNGAFTAYSFSLTGSDGKQVHFLALPRPGRNPQGKTVTVTSLAAQMPSQGRVSAAAEEQRRLLQLLDIFPAYVLLVDHNHRIRFTNRQGRRIFGSIEGELCYKALYGRDTPCETCEPFRVFSDNGARIHEWVSGKTNTAFRTYSYPFEDPEGNRLVLKFGQNITADVRARHALDLSEQRYQSIAENLTMGLALVDPQLQVVTANPIMETWFGSGTVRGASICDVLHHHCCQGSEDDCVFRMVLAHKETVELEFSLLTARGAARQFRLLACPILTRDGSVRAIVMMLEDMTERFNLARRMQQVRRLEAMGSLATGIAHEINQPLSALHLYASGLQMLLEQGSETSSERILERLSLILAQADRIRQIISHMRALVMQEDNPPLSSVAVGTAVEDALDLVGTQMREHGIEVTVNVPEPLSLVQANPVQLEQIVINLLINAMHALDTVERAVKRVEVAAWEEGGRVCLTVTDNGPGLAGVSDHIFDPFFTTKDSHKGMGLGLSIVHAFVTSWGGSIDAQDNPAGSGAVFSILLNRAVS